MWLDGLASEAEIKNQHDSITFTSEMPPTKPFISYTEGMAGSYSVALLIMVFVISRRLIRVARRGASIGAGGHRVKRLVVGQLPLALLVMLWSGFLLGTAFSAVVAIAIWFST